MEWINQLRGKIVGLDTAPLIYFIEQNPTYLTMYSVSSTIAELAAQLRATKNLKTPDAIQVATAIQNSAEFFLTNDTDLQELPHFKVLILDEIKSQY
ncbi:MAG: PIN domain-containing protein [Xenococcaceae cyanobacterium MO_188.B29]|nr:PIN domain-containing protein [Xenococcaceae cyanobacterium MO_188.B29]